MIPLKDALVCIDCETIYLKVNLIDDAPRRYMFKRCPICKSRHAVNLIEVLPIVGIKPPKYLHYNLRQTAWEPYYPYIIQTGGVFPKSLAGLMPEVFNISSKPEGVDNENNNTG